MSVLNHNGPRRYPRSTSARSFPETYYNERHGSVDYHRVEPYAYPLGGPVSALRTRAHTEREEYQPENVGARRRIAVACARCRKRKIRCSGDLGDGQGCQNCKVAGVEANQCQFHRVGSDQVHKVMDNYKMVQSLTNMGAAHNMMPLYSASGEGAYQSYPLLETKFEYPQHDTKPSYGSGWTASYGDDTSSIETYPFDQPQSYSSSLPARAGSDSYGLPCRWTPQGTRSSQPISSHYSDYGHSYITNGLPYLQTDIPTVATNEPVSPLNMSSLQLTLPERPRQRQPQPTEVPLTPRRHLPAPQPKPGRGLHHALDHQQDRRLRSSQSLGTPFFNNATSSYMSAHTFTKPLLPWSAANEKLMNAVNEATSTAMPPPATPSRLLGSAADTSPDSLPQGTSMNEASPTTGISSNDLNFGTVSLLDPSLMAAPTPPAYSNFRESRDFSASATSTQLSRNSSSSSLYAFDGASRRPSWPGDGSSSNLVSGHIYAPLSQSNGSSSLENLTEGSFEPHVSMLRTADPNFSRDC